jgi:hypothetical protein
VAVFFGVGNSEVVVILLRSRLVIALTVLVIGGSIGAWAGAGARERAAEAAAFKVVYDAAVQAHRDPEAAVRKARYITEAMSKEPIAGRAETAEDVARFLVLHGRGLCQGGLR